MESISPLRKTASVDITSHGVETARYNSLLHLDLGEEYSVHASGNKLILYDFKHNKVLVD